MAEKQVDSPKTLPNWILPWPNFTVDWARAALMIVDYQNYSSNPDVGLTRLIIKKHPQIAKYYVPRLSEVTLPNTVRLVNAFRKTSHEVIYTRHGTFLPDGRDLISRRRQREADNLESSGVPHLWPSGAYEHQIIDQLRPLPNELVIDKNSSSPFSSTGIDQFLRNMKIETLVVAGMATEMCVESTSRDAADRGYNVVVVEDAVASFFEEHHYASLSALSRVFAQVWDTDRAVSSIR